MTDTTTPTFADLGLPQFLLDALDDMNFSTPTPVQAQAIGPLAEGRDVLALAQTGTGKTAAFALPLLGKLEPSTDGPALIVLCPTRELATQVAEAIQSLARHRPEWTVAAVYGGQPMGAQKAALRRGAPIVVGTPGRIMDLMRRGYLKLDGIRAVVLDEADEMLRMGFAEDVDWILGHTPSERQVALFSATMPAAIRRLAQTHLDNPLEIRVESCAKRKAQIDQRFCRVFGDRKRAALVRWLQAEPVDAAIVFVRTKAACDELAEVLVEHGIRAAAIHGDLDQARREQVLDGLRHRRLDVAIATDVAARGIDIDRVTHVFNYDPPHDPESYTHRIGRTGRAGRSGVAILFVTPREDRVRRNIERVSGQPMTETPVPDAAAVEARRQQRFLETLTAHMEADDLEKTEASLAEAVAEKGWEWPRVAAALARALTRHAPLEVRDEQDGFGPEGGRASLADRERRPRLRAGRDEHADRVVPDGMIRYRLDVGRRHNASPREIVGALANESGISGQHIGRIRLFDEFSLVDLPQGMSPAMAQDLKRVRVVGRRIELREWRENPPHGMDRKPHRGGRHGGEGRERLGLNRR
ncbi:MAG: DEAD/DEAH box helicase [Halothiobacillaceae bacterium]